ncbi:tigger transposable element-derived protein 3-like [Bufo gargarizans]|uniref:tigger transposable element-derived protein 3-like n=1 Tax=Bufo gargarizans TaxID=30331 RepID=UPI001CF29D24|nr:tigger transposable element-derived protein 3-like [Bufo gargarizans]XP_044153915.1 tigger transposable element-derived protein 3-like [Bufo gargarizans]
MDTVNRVQTYKKRRDSTLAEKVKILELLQQPKASQSSVARNMGLSQSTISRVMKKREEILERWNHNENPGRKRNRPFKHAKVDEALLEWLLFAKANKLPISGPILMRQAEAIAKEIGCPQFKPSNGWLWRWKERYRLFYRAEVLPGERRFGSVGQGKYVKLLPTQTVRMELNNGAEERIIGSQFSSSGRIQGERHGHMMSMLCSQANPLDVLSRSALLARIAKDYPLQDIFCAVGSPFHFRILEKQGMNAEAKETVCIWFCCNINGTERLKLLVTHNLPSRSLGTHCLSPVSLKASNNGHMTDSLLVEWLLNWDAKLDRLERKILLAFTAHNTGPKVKLRNISLCIFPKEHVSSNHRFGEELVSEFSILYRELLLERLQEDTTIDGKTEVSLLHKMGELSLVEASYTMNKAWLRVTPHTIKSCFQKLEGIRILCSATHDPSEARSHEDISFPILQEPNSNSENYTSLTTGCVSYRTLTIKEENDESLGFETTYKKPPYPNEKVKVDFSSNEDQASYSGLESYPKLSAIDEISTVVVKSEESRPCVSVEEIREACDLIQRFLCNENQDMSIFCALQSQIERCLANPTMTKSCK